MATHVIKVCGSDPPCHRCKITEKIVKEAALELGLDAQVSHLSAYSAEADSYGIMLTPTIVIDGKLTLSGKVPSKGEMKRILRSLSLA
jgi:small redox-active disulfide protein 2